MSSSAVRSPFVYWAQNAKHVFLRIDLKDVSKHRILIANDEVSVFAVGMGAQGIPDCPYECNIEFFLPVKKTESKYQVNECDIRIVLEKEEADWWPRLLYKADKVAWLKIDFDRWTGEDSDDDDNPDGDDGGDNDDMSSQDLLRNRYPEVYKQLQKEELGFVSEGFKKNYLFCYNLFMFCGFLYVSVLMALRYAKDADEFLPECFATVGPVFILLHLMMFLEVLHPMFGYTRGSSLEALLQVGGRNFVLLGLIDAEPRMQDKPVVFYLFAIYSLAELVRYPYYMLHVYGLDVGLITWLRYTLWVLLYPAGFVCEGVVMLRNIPYFEETGKFTIGLPNKWNFGFHFPSFLRLYLLLFFFPMLYAAMNHMYSLRCKKLGVKQYAKRKRKDD